MLLVSDLRRLLTTDPSQLQEDLPGELQSLSWLTSVDVPRLQQMADGRGGGGGDFNGPSQGQGGSLLEQQTGETQTHTHTPIGGACTISNPHTHSDWIVQECFWALMLKRTN